MTRQLRDNKTKIGPKTGLVLANGGNLTYQHVIILSSKPPFWHNAIQRANTLPDVITDVPVPQMASRARGKAKLRYINIKPPHSLRFFLPSPLFFPLLLSIRCMLLMILSIIAKRNHG